MSDLPKGAIAVIGMACRFPGARCVDDFWRNLRDGIESIIPLSDEVLRSAGVKLEEFERPNYVKAAAVLDGVERFDAEFFGFSPKEASIMDPQHRHFLECSWEALEHAGYDSFSFEGSIGVFAGCGMQAYFAQNLLPNRHLIDSTGLFLVRHTGNDKDFLSNRISYQFNLRGPSISIQTACSTSLVAIHLASQSLLTGECEMALAGGVTIELPHRRGYVYEEGEILSGDGHCRAFDAASTGTVFGSGVGVVVLRPLEDALAQGDRIHAVILGSAVNNDGAGKVSYLAPSVDGQAAAVAEALGVAGVEASTITFVETHGTGTQIGDPIEIKALTQAYRESTNNRSFCALGAVKTNIGHLDTAAGVAGFIKAVLALQHRQLPPTLHFTRPNSKIDFASTPFYVNATLRDWILPAGVPRRRAAVNSLGVGGTNAHVILEEFPTLPVASDPPAGQLLVWSAQTADGLQRQVRNFVEFLKDHAESNLADVAFTLQRGRHAFPHRCVLAVADVRDAVRALDVNDRRRIFDGVAAKKAPPLAFMFPGGGAQYPDMGRELYQREPVYSHVVDESLNLLRQQWNIELRNLLFPQAGMEASAAAQLERPLNSIVSVFITEYALARLWISMGIEPQVMTGHSLGEYTAACLAGVMSLREALAIVVARGFIFEKLSPGAMLSVALSEEAIRPWLVSEHSLAAVNGPELCVVSGTVDAIKDLEEQLVSRDVDCQRLRISVAAHSAMLDQHLDDFRRVLDGIQLKSPTIPFISNLTGELATAEMVTTTDYWVRHLRQTVQFSSGLIALHTLHPDCLLLEMGPGTTLTGLARQHRIERREPVAIPCMRHAKDPGSDVVALLSALGRLWTAGFPVDWSLLHRGQTRRRVPLPTYPFQGKNYWIDAPVGSSPSVSFAPQVGLKRRSEVESWLAQTVWAPSPLENSVAIEADAFILVGGEERERDGLSAELRRTRRETDAASFDDSVQVFTVRKGQNFSIVSQELWTADLDSKSGMAELVDYAFSRCKWGVCFVLINETHERSGAPSTNGASRRRAENSFFGIVRFVQCLGERVESKPCWIRVVTREAFSVANEAEVDPTASLAVGACRVIRRELPDYRCKVIDVPKTSALGWHRTELLRQLALEIALAGDEREVALRAGKRWTSHLAPVSWPIQAGGNSLLIKSGVYLITGGLGGLGLELANHLARNYGARLVLISRRPVTSGADDIAAMRADHLQELQSLTEVLCCTADVTDLESMRSAVESAERRFGKINGVFHCAGELNDGLLLTKSRAEMERVLHPKVAGALILDQLFAQSALDFMAFYSSVSAYLGIPGQVDYAAANAFLDALAARSVRNRDYPVLSLGWGAWREAGMAARATQSRPSKTRILRHPIWDRRTFGLNGTSEFFGMVDAEQNWMLDGHRTHQGVALLPGTGFLELARAAVQAALPGQTISLGDVVFISPLVVQGPTEIRLQLEEPNREFVVASRPVVGGAHGEWVEHARGRFGLSSEVAPPREDLSAYRAACLRKREFGPGEPATRQEQMLRFGARWSTLRNASFGEGMAVGELELQPEFVSDLAETPLHPALVDIATAFALPLVSGYETANTFYVPLSYKQVIIYRDLEPSIRSVVRCKDTHNSDTVIFDVTLVSRFGDVLVEIEEFVMKRLPNQNLQVKQVRPSPSAATITSTSEMTLHRLVADGIGTAEGMRVLDCLLRVGCPYQVLVSPYDPNAWSALLDASAAARNSGSAKSNKGQEEAVVSQSRPAISTPFVAPANELEQRLASIWKDSLGLAEIGVDDNFFQLGGHSLGLVQIIMKCRKALRADIPVGDPQFLANPTIKAMARFAIAGSDSVPVPEMPGIKRISRETYRVT